MRTITIADVNKRIRSLQAVNESSTELYESTAHSISETGSVNDIKLYIESGIKSNKDISLNTYLELFDALVEKGNVSSINKYGKFIASEAVSKVRDAKQTLILLHRRLGRVKSKINNPITKQLDDLTAQHQSSGAGAGSDAMPQTQKPVAEPMTAAEHIKQDKDNAVAEAYNLMIEQAQLNGTCDRIIENYNNVSKRFNLEVLFNENTRRNGVYDTVVELCNFVDTYDMPDIVKFNTVIETSWYGFERNGIPYSKHEVLEGAIDFFAFKENGIHDCKQILEATVLYNKDDYKDLDIITEEEPEEDEGIPKNEAMSGFYAVAKFYNNVAPKFFSESTEDSFNKIFDDFKKNELKDHPENKLKSLVGKLYSLKPSDIIHGTPRLLTWIRTFFVVGSCAVPGIGPFLMIINFIADKILSLHMERKELAKMEQCFADEIKKTKDKIAGTKDKENKERLEKYLEKVKEAHEKIESAYSDTLTDRENDERYEKKFANASIDDEYDDFFDLGDMLESVAGYTESIAESFKYINKYSMFALPSKLNNTMVELVAEAISKYPDELYFEDFAAGISSCIRDEKRKKAQDGAMQHLFRINALENAWIAAKNISESKPINTIDESAEHLKGLKEVAEAISILISNEQVESDKLLEASFLNSIKLAQMKLKNSLQKMSDKDRKVSKDIDLAMNNISKNAERALTNDNREAVLKGSILPSASKCIKLAITTGILWLIEPAVAVIALLGYIACSVKFKTRERQMVADELEIELKVCDKYLEQADNRNDMKAYKELLTIKRNLERQLQRVKYKMAVKGSPYVNTDNVANAFDRSSRK